MIRLAVRVPSHCAELVLADLLELAPGGVEEAELDGGIVEYAIYGAPGELPSLGKLQAAVGGSLVEVVSEELADDWETRWREFHRPATIGDSLTIRPPWARRSRSPVDVVIDPGQAFGTGAHPSTRLCLELLLELEPTGAFLDLGCGSGVLGIVAATRGYQPVMAVDNDPAAIHAAAENARHNRVEIDIRRHDLRADPVLTAETVAANLLAPLLLAWADRLAQAPPPRRLVVGGLLTAETTAVSQAFAGHGLRSMAERSSGDWAALLLAADP